MLHRRLLMAALPTLAAGTAFAQSSVGQSPVPSSATAPTLQAPAVQAGQITNVVDTLAALGGFNQFLGYAQRAGAVETLRGAGPFILLAPDDRAMNRIPQSFLRQLAPPQPTGQQASQDQERLTAFINSHIVESDLTLSALMGRSAQLRTRNGNILVVEAMPGQPVVVEATMVGGQGAGGITIEPRTRFVERAEVRASNGAVWPISIPILV
jgi:uncharacterized surface protein with fasciclin (FAS1) repeats